VGNGGAGVGGQGYRDESQHYIKNTIKICSLQDFELTANGNVLVLDWFTAGRVALGEVWDMTR